MAFTVEDGTGLAAANSYQSVADIKAFFADRGLTLADTYSDAQIEASAVRATDYMDKRWGRLYRGWKRSQAQRLAWPRIDAFDDAGFLFDDLPNELLWAHAEYTLLDLQLSTLTPLPDVPFPTVDPDTGTVSTGTGILKSSEDTVGPISEKRSYAESSQKPMGSTGSRIQQVRVYPVADLWMEEITDSSVSRDLRRG